MRHDKKIGAALDQVPRRMVVWLAPDSLEVVPVSLAPWSISRGITLSGVPPGRPLSNHPEHDRNHEPKRQYCSKSVKSHLQCHVTNLVERVGLDFVSLLFHEARRSYARVALADKRKAFCNAERSGALTRPFPSRISDVANAGVGRWFLE